MEIAGAEEDLIQIKTESRETKQKLMTEQEEMLVIFPEITSWQTSKGEVVPVYEDYNGRGTDYQLAGFWNMQMEQGIKVSEIMDEITPENRICTLEQAEVYMKAVECFIEEMKPEENARYDCPVYRTDKEKDGWSR